MAAIRRAGDAVNSAFEQSIVSAATATYQLGFGLYITKEANSVIRPYFCYLALCCCCSSRAYTAEGLHDRHFFCSCSLGDTSRLSRGKAAF